MKVTISAILDLWFEPGTAADAATCANNYCDRANKTWTADRVRAEWAKAKEDGVLPDFVRPVEGFRGEVGKLVRKLKVRRVPA